jgi:TPR repeat protein
VAKDYSQALRWFREAANQGSPEAQSTLAAMYYKGLGLPASNVEAYAWAIRALEHEDQKWTLSVMLAPTRDLRRSLISEMSRVEISEAQRVAGQRTLNDMTGRQLKAIGDRSSEFLAGFALGVIGQRALEQSRRFESYADPNAHCKEVLPSQIRQAVQSYIDENPDRLDRPATLIIWDAVMSLCEPPEPSQRETCLAAKKTPSAMAEFMKVLSQAKLSEFLESNQSCDVF